MLSDMKTRNTIIKNRFLRSAEMPTSYIKHTSSESFLIVYPKRILNKKRPTPPFCDVGRK